jgi:ubiquinol-cytochrome c reductase cytochrome c subunit
MTNRTLTAAAVAAGVAALVFAGCTSAVGPYRAPVEASGSERSGAELYLRDCAWCHGNQGEGTARAPDLISGQNGPAFTDFMLSTGRMPISRSNERIERREPAYTPEEIDAIVDYVGSLGGSGPRVPQPNLVAGELHVGLELYQENCAACHAPTIIGGALTAGGGPEARSPVAPGLSDSSPREIAEAMLVGPGAMPVFGPNTFDEEQVDSIVAYVVDQQTPADRGGAPIGHVGPVAEGAIGWIVGLGAMLVLIRLIGTRVQR